jgi:Nucleoside-diphosphate-sugar pyrophosphorylase involved in lipopolysaccharide biosynthesis/translation initiation factor 2B, gamma/epsilon subunits (eIF-2Bgamma/eIF-2Bepsilon)
MIFSAGLGTRFKPWTDTHPKALALVNGKSLLATEHRISAAIWHREVIVNVHHFADQVEEAIRVNDGWGSRVWISNERDELLDTGGGLLKASDLFTPGEKFMTLNVDILTDLSITRLLEFHDQANALISFGVTNRKTSRYLLFDETNRLCGWRNTKTGEEKIARGEDVLIQKAYSCVVVFEYAIFKLIPFKGKFSLIDVYLALAAGQRIMGYDHSGDRLVDVGKPESVAVAEKLFS